METLQKRASLAGDGAAFLARQRFRLEFTRDALLRELEEPGALETADEIPPNTLARGILELLESKLWLRLASVQRALQKIDEGTYGICDETGEPIPRDRLEAVPEAIYTIEAQRRRENRS
ncbi:MAG: TraR/DksA C4-type zinc finger protein [Rubrobacteraceae bacterium]|nr:TraR/DksA C4-type zinc finger protein [Rubrobacteraceae bacterium]MCL6438687.1 TraR/DksA C4-type zinc finger protein [Rubrobacteraceae bacterium]